MELTLLSLEGELKLVFVEQLGVCGPTVWKSETRAEGGDLPSR